MTAKTFEPSASRATASKKELSSPPEKATTRDPRSSRRVKSRSCLVFKEEVNMAAFHFRGGHPQVVHQVNKILFGSIPYFLIRFQTVTRFTPKILAA